eukprot:TRINITY_DN35585_c0_g1_i1.p1 TRINITY_DN35585_c0_g1~~TRINITY_DN35585_c0_g1_i1.p1  ORF type:complete len:601 (-),score=77.84 TRINITY_DN35585_c0_g1_i1:29-1831(-)
MGLASSKRCEAQANAENVTVGSRHPDETWQSPPMPYEYRALTLDQLHLIDTAFVKNGWLQDQCCTYNEAEKANIEAGIVHSLSANLYAISRFVVSPLTDPLRWKDIPHELRQLASLTSKPTRTCSYAELINPSGILVTVFVSHFWGHPFTRTLAALNAYATSITQVHLRRFNCWICVFALNQHAVSQEVGMTLEAAPFNIAIKQSDCWIAMVVDDSLLPLSRLWCLFEVQRAHDLQRPLALIDEHGSVADSSDIAKLTNILSALDKVSAFTADASMKYDKDQIQYCIADEWVCRTCPSFARFLRHTERRPLLGRDFSTFDTQVGRLLCEPLLKAAVRHQDSQVLLRCVGLGAGSNADAVQVLDDLGIDLSIQMVPTRFATAPQSVASVMAYFGNLEGLQFLHKAGVCLQVQGANGWMPGHFAAQCGHTEIVDFLIRAGVDFQLRTQSGRVPAHFAAQMGHTEIIRLLWRAGFDIGATDRYGRSGAHAAAQNNRREVLELLLEIGVDLQARDVQGWSPAHFAAESGHNELVDFFCEQRSQCYQRSEVEAHLLQVDQEVSGSPGPTLLRSILQSASTHEFMKKSASEESLRRQRSSKWKGWA